MQWTAEMFETLAHNCEDSEAAVKAAGILNDTLAPETVEATAAWMRRCFHAASPSEEKMHALNVLFDCHGVETIRVEGAWINRYHGDIVASYLNTGDTYVETIVLESETGEFVLTSYGDWLEAYEATEGSA